MMRFDKRMAVFATAVMTAIFAIAGPARAQQVIDNRPKITVSGEAVVYAQPDKILVSLGVETWDAQMDVAKQKNDAIIKRAIAAIRECGIEKSAIQTDNITIEPTYKPYEGSRPRDIDGYSVRNSLTVTVDKVAKVEQLITNALKSGVNHVNNVDFQTTELRKYRDQARKLALKAAREKAENMADVYGQTIGRPLQIVENGGYGYWYGGWGGWGSSGRDYGMSQNVMLNATATMPSRSSEEQGETVALGKIGIRANVSVVFELKDK
jgi:uncharacterized protein